MDNEPSKDKETMIRVDGFDSIKIYEQVASKLSEELLKEGLSLDIKLAKNKWNAFKKKSDNTTILQSMMQHNWVAEEDSMTHYRNLHDSNVVVLLGTEDEEDKGGLANFQSITPDILIKTLNGKYHLIFNDDSFTDSDNEVIDRLYKDLFEFEAIDICKLSDIADSWNGKISNSKDFIELFFNELPTWGLPLRRLELPKRQEIMGRKNVLAGCHRFIVRQPFNSKMSITQYNKYMKRSPYGVRVTAVELGDIHTGFTQARQKTALGDDEYGGRISHSVSQMEKDELSGMSPEVIGTYIARIAQKKNCAPICVAGVKYKILRFLCKILPCTLRGKIVGSIYAK